MLHLTRALEEHMLQKRNFFVNFLGCLWYFCWSQHKFYYSKSLQRFKFNQLSYIDFVPKTTFIGQFKSDSDISRNLMSKAISNMLWVLKKTFLFISYLAAQQPTLDFPLKPSPSDKPFHQMESKEKGDKSSTHYEMFHDLSEII